MIKKIFQEMRFRNLQKIQNSSSKLEQNQRISFRIITLRSQQLQS